VLVVLSVLVCPMAAWAQDLATIIGTVTDPTGGAIPGAKIVVSNTDKGFVRNLVSAEDGGYIAARIPIGAYVISAQATGFEKLTQTGVTLDAGQTQRVDLHLRLGPTQQEVTVIGNIPRVETETGAVSTVITGTQITQLNLVSRNFIELSTLAPGVVDTQHAFSTIGSIMNLGISFNGTSQWFNNWELDGANDVDRASGSSAIMVFPSIDSIAEFRISSSNYSADSGKAAGANVQYVTKSGTNQFHGDAYEFVRNDKFDANDWFINQTIAPPGGNAPKTPLKRNDFGFTLGGPLYIPGFYNTDKQKTFFFVSEEWRRHREGTIVNQGDPTVRMRQGDFSECDPASPNYTIAVASGCQLPTDPATGKTFANDLVPVDPTAQTLLNSLIPLPNNGPDRYTKAFSLPTNFQDDMIRVDHNITDKTRIFFRYTQDSDQDEIVPALWASSSFATVRTTLALPTKNAVLHLTQSFRPDLMNEVIVSFSDDPWNMGNTPGFDSPSGSIAKPSGFVAKTIFPANQAQPLLPGIVVSGGLPFSFAQSTGYKFTYLCPQPELKDNLVWMRGKHTLKFGFFLNRNVTDESLSIGSGLQGLFGFSNSSTVTTGNALADFFLGRIATYQEQGRVVNGELLGGGRIIHSHQMDFEPYFQDDWRASRRLTLNMGVRYYYLTPFYDVSNPTNDSIFIPSQYNPADQAQLDINGNIIPGTGANYLNYGNGLVQCGSGAINKGCVKPYHKTISPRFGFSYDPTGSGKTAIRGGYALTWDPSNPGQTDAGFWGNPPTLTVLYSYNVVGFDNIGPGALGPSSFNNVPRSEKFPQVDQFSLGVQHEFPGNNLLSVSYVGSLNRYLQVSRNINQVPIGVGTVNVPALANTPGCGSTGNCDVQNILMNNLEPSIFFVPYRGYTSIGQRENTGVSHYDSLQANFRHTFGRGLTFQAIYTWSHNIDNVTTNGVNDYDLSRWRGNSLLDRPQSLVMNYVYLLPFFGHSTNAFVHNALGGWQVNGITSFQSGAPLDVSCGIAGMSSGVGGPVVCNSLGKFGVKKGTFHDPEFGPVPTWFDPGTIGQVTLAQLQANGQPGMFGYMGKNPLNGPGRNNWDLALMKNIQTPWFKGEHSSVQIRWETFNTFNHPQWNSVNAFCSGLTLPGQPCNGSNNIGNGEVAGAYPPRVMQFGLKFIF
jgi:hypothetical protein